MEIEKNVNPDDDWNDAQWIEDEIDAEDAEIDKLWNEYLSVVDSLTGCQTMSFPDWLDKRGKQ